jgi:hypothetical protein
MELAKATDQEILQEIHNRNKRGTIFSLRHADNGWIAESVDAEGVSVIAEDDEKDSHTAFAHFLSLIDGAYGPSSSKYDEKRIRVVTLPGNDYPGPISKEYAAYLIDLRDEINDALNVNVQGNFFEDQ